MTTTPSTRFAFCVFSLVLGSGLAAGQWESPGERLRESKAPETFAQPLWGGCYLTGANQCRIHVEPFTIPVNEGAGERVAEFILFANNVSGGPSFQLYHFHSDNTYGRKPVGNYSPTLVTQDFYGQCGETYYLNIITRGDTSTTTGSFGNAGRTGEFTCPESPNLTTTSGAIQQGSLQLDKGAQDIQLSWGTSCLGTDTDYEIYAGAVGDFASHQPLTCSTGGARSAAVRAAATDSYFLVVPRNDLVEGSYGQDSSLGERPVSLAPCLETSPAVCG